jgi:hypothetical protein
MTLTDIISKRTLYGNGIIVNDNSSNNTVVINKSGSGDALKITQSGSGNALLIEDESSPDSSPTVINSNGNVVVGNSTNLYGANVELYRQDVGTSLSLKKSTSNSSGPSIAFIKSRGTTQDSNALVSAGDLTGFISFQGTDGTGAKQSAAIAAIVDAAPSGSDMPGRIEFLTSPNGSATPVERMRITSTGRVGIGTSNPAATLHVNGTIRMQNLPTYANNTAAIAGGLAADDVYKTSTGELRIVY